MAEVSAALDSVGTRGRTLRVVGEPGVGKSELLRAATAEAIRRGMSVRSASGYEAEQHLPFAVLHELLRPILSQADALPAGHRSALMTAFGLDLSRAAPEPLFIALAALELVADAGAEAPLLLVIDDLQWVDSASRDVVGFIARRLANEQMVMLVAERPGGESVVRDARCGHSGAGRTVERHVEGAPPATSTTPLARRRAGRARDGSGQPLGARRAPDSAAPRPTTT